MSGEGAPTLDVVVVTYRNRETIGRLLKSLKKLRGWAKISVLLHDNSNDFVLLKSSAEACDELALPLLAEACAENCGFARACNSMAARADGDWILFINPDAEIIQYPTSWLPKAGVWGPEIFDETGKRSFLYGRSRSLWSEVLRIVRRHDQAPIGSGYVSGACLLIDRNSFETLGGFDERFYMFYEDIDLGLRASASGTDVQVNSEWKVLHSGGHSSLEGKDRVMCISAESSVAFHAKHGHCWRGWALGMATYLAVRSLVARISDRATSAALLSASREYLRLWREGPHGEAVSDWATG